jgi:hypothetical protein
MSNAVSNGTITTTASAQTIVAPAVAGNFFLLLDLSNMAAGDIILVECLRKLLPADGGELTLWETPIAFAGAARMAESPIIKSVGSGCRFRITRIGGADRAYRWSLETP